MKLCNIALACYPLAFQLCLQSKQNNQTNSTAISIFHHRIFKNRINYFRKRDEKITKKEKSISLWNKINDDLIIHFLVISAK
jgi:hypothetical protein